MRDAVRTGRAETPEALGALLRAGTNCGSCLPDLKRIIAHERTPASH
ncbi:bacterioferritin-associated ferredoxin [Salinarimonas soli]